MAFIPAEFCREPVRFTIKVRDWPMGELTTTEKLSVLPESELAQRIGNIIADEMKEQYGDRLIVSDMTIAIQCSAMLRPKVQ